MADNRRHAYRLAIELPVQFWLGALDASAPLEGATVDISSGGIGLVTSEELEVPSRIQIRLEVAQPRLSLTVEGEVVHRQVHDDRLFYGVAFRNLDTATRSELVKYVFAQAKELGQGSAPARKPKAPVAPHEPGAIERLLRAEDIPKREAAGSFVDATMAAIVQLILDGDDATISRYPQTEDMLSWHVQQRALAIARERSKREQQAA